MAYCRLYPLNIPAINVKEKYLLKKLLLTPYPFVCDVAQELMILPFFFVRCYDTYGTFPFQKMCCDTNGKLSIFSPHMNADDVNIRHINQL